MPTQSLAWLRDTSQVGVNHNIVVSPRTVQSNATCVQHQSNSVTTKQTWHKPKASCTLCSMHQELAQALSDACVEIELRNKTSRLYPFGCTQWGAHWLRSML